MFTQILFFYHDSVMLNAVKHLAKSHGRRNSSGKLQVNRCYHTAESQREILAFPLRASDLKVHDVQDDRDLWVNCHIITKE